MGHSGEGPRPLHGRHRCTFERHEQQRSMRICMHMCLLENNVFPEASKSASSENVDYMNQNTVLYI